MTFSSRLADVKVCRCVLGVEAIQGPTDPSGHSQRTLSSKASARFHGSSWPTLAPQSCARRLACRLTAQSAISHPRPLRITPSMKVWTRSRCKVQTICALADFCSRLRRPRSRRLGSSHRHAHHGGVRRPSPTARSFTEPSVDSAEATILSRVASCKEQRLKLR
jgi:hypothetical protein